MRILWVHVTPITRLGGAELGIRSRINHAPPDTRIDVVSPSDEVDLQTYDALILGNLRPSGGVGEKLEVKWVERWSDLISRFRGFSLKTEHDLHPCAHRDARCIAFEPIRKLPCECGSLISSKLEELYNLCSAVQFLSPSHQTVINCLVRIRSRQYVIAPPIDLGMFRAVTPFENRKRAALIIGDEIRVAKTAEEKALSHGFPAERIEYLSLPYEEMPAVYNRYQAVVVDPFMFHAFGRVAVEAMACGCQVIASKRVGAFSWDDPLEACRRSHSDFWDVMLKGVRERLPWISRLRRKF
jgi:hypothetical protein